MDDEAQEIIATLPEGSPDRDPYPGINWKNCIYTEMRDKDGMNRLPINRKWVCIYLESGEWLAFPADQAIGDFAPYCG
jgi:hypothetical protein